MFRRASRTTDELHLSWYHSVTLYQQILKYQRIYLASHVLYGSSRLGTKDYLPGQIYSLVDYQQAQPVIDTAVLNSRRSWYSGKYNDNIQANATTAWGHTQTDPFGSSERIGEKQYELTNHLGNVQATVSDNPYLVAQEATDTILATHPALRSAYDYYPFGMLMPGRYVSDTSQHCVTVTQPTWGWKEVTVACWDVYAWVWPGYTRTGEGTAVVDGDAVKINAPNATDAVSFDFPVTPNVQQELNLDIKQVSLNDKASVQIMEQQGENWVTLAQSPINVVSGGMTIPFRPTGSSIRVVWHGKILVWVRHDCISKLEWVEEDQLVTICDGDKDKYRFGFNGQEKVNEWAGIGNHNTAKFWEYDTRTGRRLNLDPKPSSSISNYSSFANNPILYSDVLGDTVRIKGTEEFKNKTLTKLQLLTNDKLEFGKDGLVTIKNSGTANKGKKLTNGTVLVNYLVGNKHPNIIEETKGNNKTQSITVISKDKKTVHKKYGVILFNPYKTKAGKDATGNTERPVEIGLGHELIHVKRNNNGTEVNSPSDVPDPDNPGFNLNKDEVETRNEENLIRREQNLPDRIKE